MRPPRFTLRRRVGAAFALVSMTVTGLLGVATWNLASNYLLSQREQSATRQAMVNVRLVEQSLTDGAPAGLGDLLTGIAGGPDTTIALRRQGNWTTSGRQLDPDSLPSELVELAGSGTAVRQRIVSGGIPVLAVGLPISTQNALYVELFPLVELDRTLRFLSAVLLGGVAASTVLGLGIGWWAARQALRPLTELNAAAGRVAAGDLGTRLPEGGDGDLAPLATTFNRTADALEQRVRRDARFAADVSHELRSPLTTLINAVAVLRRRRGELSEPARQAVDLLDGDIHRFHRMVVDLLEISRNESGLDERDLDLCDFVDLVRRAVLERRGRVPVEVLGRPPSIRADRRRIDHAIGNVLDNADAHAGGVVRITVSGQDGRARLEVDDAGPGIPPELREEVFERFARGLSAGQRADDGGSGLGLALVARHIRSHGGEVWIEQRPGGGARVIIELPGAPA
ncbi:HAMP domain-containing sensor histidine kinase [Pseudonocardia sp. KRD291]|uniref:HAMP domain-containing sensor histidine kinase n=1 Tax=Pseudonocardia sp. KRD291 TaxID=2792007 RepID=UPI001C4A49CA|nr:HAMP domain-containing sensor histidine kinase [Pseudonocardia sp. KRD291]MBW0101773.1 HAMP domain-containing histidine kinase [Pseudonocardia sp. KRD291]